MVCYFYSLDPKLAGSENLKNSIGHHFPKILIKQLILGRTAIQSTKANINNNIIKIVYEIKKRVAITSTHWKIHATNQAYIR